MGGAPRLTSVSAIANSSVSSSNSEYVRPPRPITVKEGWMGQMRWPTQAEPEALLLVAAWKPQKARHARSVIPSFTSDDLK